MIPKSRRIQIAPYPYHMYLAKDADEYCKFYLELIGEENQARLSRGDRYSDGRTYMGPCLSGEYIYIVFAECDSVLVHEIAHVILDVFGNCGVDPSASNGEPFCYALGDIFDKCRSILGRV